MKKDVETAITFNERFRRTITSLDLFQWHSYILKGKDRISRILQIFKTHASRQNKAKGRISKRVFQESKARQNFRKTNNS